MGSTERTQRPNRTEEKLTRASWWIELNRLGLQVLEQKSLRETAGFVRLEVTEVKDRRCLGKNMFVSNLNYEPSTTTATCYHQHSS